MKEENDAGPPLLTLLFLVVAQDLREKHQMIIMHPHDAVAVILPPASQNNEALYFIPSTCDGGNGNELMWDDGTTKHDQSKKTLDPLCPSDRNQSSLCYFGLTVDLSAAFKAKSHHGMTTCNSV